MYQLSIDTFINHQIVNKNDELETTNISETFRDGRIP